MHTCKWERNTNWIKKNPKMIPLACGDSGTNMVLDLKIFYILK